MAGPSQNLIPAKVKTRLGALSVRIHGEGPVTVLWPSMFVDGDTWDLLVPRIRGRRLVIVDGPGLGESDALTRESDIAGAAGAAIDLLTGLADAGLIHAEPVDWVGNAFGGHVGYELAVRSGILRSLVAISAPVEPVPASLRRQIRLLHPLLRAFGPMGPVRDAVIQAMLTDASAADPELRAVVLDSLARPSKASLSLALKSFILNRKDVTSHLTRLTVPALFLAGDDRGDWSPEDAERAAVAAPDARAVTIHGARTLLPLERPVEVARALDEFWTEIRAYA